jgi:hypothetical protein
MSDREHFLPRSWLLPALPGKPETSERLYTFDLGHLDYVVDRQAVYLHIPEIGCRDAEGRPRYPEQESWIVEVLAERRIRAKEIWWSHWQFETPQDADAFERLLWDSGAMRLWILTRRSKERGVLLERYRFRIVPSAAGTISLDAETEPEGPTFRRGLASLIRRTLTQHQIAARKTPRQLRWEFPTPDAANRFEHAIKKKGALYQGESYFL